jgi:hypothetical protein
MIWQEESQIILMITNEEEKGKVRESTERYFNSPKDLNGLIVVLFLSPSVQNIGQIRMKMKRVRSFVRI